MTNIPKAILVDVGREWIRFGLLSDEYVVGDLARWPFVTGLMDMVKEFAASKGLEPKNCIVAIAAPGPFRGDVFSGMAMNIEYEISAGDFQKEFAYAIVVHDVAAGAQSTLVLERSLYRTIAGIKEFEAQSRQPMKGIYRKPRAYIQTGVGLGAACLVPIEDDRWLAFTGEGGSMSLGLAPAPNNDANIRNYLEQGPGLVCEEKMVLDEIRRLSWTEKKWGYPTAQSLLSAQTLPIIYNLLGGTGDYDPETITSLAKGNSNTSARRAVNTFARILGIFAADVVLSYGASDGLYIGGPIPAVFDDEMEKHFLLRFTARGAASPQLQETPVHIVEFEYNALFGLASIIDTYESEHIV